MTQLQLQSRDSLSVLCRYEEVVVPPVLPVHVTLTK